MVLINATHLSLVFLCTDYIVVGADSGRITILEYNPAKNVFERVSHFRWLWAYSTDSISPQIHQETFGKSGCRRIVPGQYLAVDPKGRAIMIGTYV